MRNVTILTLFSCLLLVGTAAAQEAEYFLTFPAGSELNDPYTSGLHSGARGVNGPFDLDGDGLAEVLVTDYTSGGRVHVVENTGVDGWVHVYSTPALDSTASGSNARYAAGADLDGDGFGEIVFISGHGFSETNPNIADYPIGLYVFEYTGTDNDYGIAPASVLAIESGNVGVPPSVVSEQFTVMDVDGDDIQEVLIPSNSSNDYDIYYVYSVTGDIGSGFEVYTLEAEINPRSDGATFGGGSPYAVLPADLDGDGTYELNFHSWNNFNFFNADIPAANTYVFPASGAENTNLQAAPSDHVALFGGTAADVNSDGDDEVFYPRYQSFSNAQVTVLNWETGESILEISEDNVALDIITGLTNFGLTAGDLTGDGQPELIGAGPSFLPSAFDRNESSFFIRYAEFVGGQGGNPEDPNNYVVRAFDTRSARDTLAFDTVYRDSAGVMTKYFIDSGANDPVFPAKVAYLGDADGDGNAEVAVSFQGQDDSLTVFNEVYAEGVGDALFTKTPADLPAYLGTGSTERSLAYNPETDDFLVASRIGGTVSLFAFDAETGEISDTLSTEGVGGAGILFPINEIDVTSDGQIFATGLTLSGGANYRLYWWEDQDADPVVIWDGVIESNARFGDAIGVDGSGDDVDVYLSGTENFNVALFNFTGSDSTMVEAPTLIPLGGDDIARGGIAAAGEGQIWVNGAGNAPTLISTADGSVIATIDDEAASPTMDVDFVSTSNGDLLAVGPGQDEQFLVYDVTDPQNARLIGTSASLASGGTNTFFIGDVSFDEDGETLYALSTNNGFAAFPVAFGYTRTVRERIGVEQRIFMRIYDTSTQTVANERTPETMPEAITLSGNYPNPFNPTTTFAYTLPETAAVTVRVYDVMGRVVKTLVRNAQQTPGTYELTWDATNDAGLSVSSGTYFYAVESDGQRLAKPMVLVK